MQSYIQEEHEIFRQSLRKFLEREAAPFYEEWEKDRMIPRFFWKKMGKEGFLCPWLSEEYGGLEADFAYSVILIQELERIGSSLVGIGLHNDIVVPYIAQYGTEEQKKRWLPACVSGDMITAIAMTEPGAGSDLSGIQTTAIKEGNHYIVNGSKTFITNGIQSDLVVVVCKTDPTANPPHKGISLLVVERDTPGFQRGEKLNKVGLHSQDTAELFFEDAKVPTKNLLGQEGQGFYYLMEQLQQERLVVAIAAEVSARRVVELTKAYVKERKAFGQPIAHFQHTEFTLVELETEVEIGKAFLDQVISRHMNREDVVKEVSMAKWWLTDLAKKAVAKCMQLFGGYGYMEEYEIARRFRDIPVSSIYAGSNEIMKTIIAKKIGLRE
ncbi:acyl-CoA dehydrogenase family protein [Aliibacillus thermotolerans]|uniref:Acyl-CoA dehydrogenase family protein n=1 Tax=Aliibacillus thermotolerans TaxID=1834418 RepID=A0ABW0U674_9BACI|nr:acyl-CoA dehydrogenase family protein [Aliibacillus thermotolerans]MDA3129364.1 acyl-CoA dehydrogenase [Aliibacillus thermotolerans]